MAEEEPDLSGLSESRKSHHSSADDYREEVALALRGIPSLLADAVMGMNPNRAACRDIARWLRELHAETVRILGERAADDLVLPTLVSARARVLGVFGTSGWDDPELSRTLPPRG